MRWLLVLLLLNGFVPGIADGAVAAVHLIKTGHVVHAASCDDERGERGAEHSCGVVLHQCDCCASMTVVPHDRAEVGEPVHAAKHCAPGSVACGATRSLEPPFRPPIH